MPKEIKILGIDPGYGRVGVAVISGTANKPVLEFSTCLETESKTEFSKRLRYAFEEIEKIIQKYEPTHMAIEDIYINTNQKTAIKVAEARGVFLFLAEIYDMKIGEYTPLQVKNNLTGYGRAEKSQVEYLVKKIFKINTDKKIDDEVDAIAIALTHLYSYKILSK
jgi:crossover junction endodeoxyribonuclease RuvC